jgi:hypothetical protein
LIINGDVIHDEEGERADVYSLQELLLEDLSIIATVESKLVVRPRIMMPGVTFIHPDEMVKLALDQALLSKVEPSKSSGPSGLSLKSEPLKPPEPSGTSPKAESSKPPKSKSSEPSKPEPSKPSPQPAKTAPKAVVKNVAPVKKLKVSPFAPKKPAVDLKAKLQLPMFHTEKDDASVSSSTSEDDQNVDDMPKSTDQQFVVFSSEDETEPNSPMLEDTLEETLDSPMEIDQVNNVNDNNDISSRLPMTTISSGPRMKMIKVPRTFMENGYLMTEMVTEMVPNEDDENSSSPELAQRVASPKGEELIKPVISAKKQGNLLSFFKPKQLN